MNRIALAVCALLLSAAPGWASSFQVWEDSLGSPGVTAQFPTGNGLLADIDFDADSAEGGGLLLGASEFEIRPTGSVIFVMFTCQLADCEYNFAPGDAGANAFLLVTDGDPLEKHGIFDLGTIQFDAAGLGTIELLGCNYSDTDGQAPAERTCDPFTLVSVPEPASGALVGLALGVLAGLRRRR